MQLSEAVLLFTSSTHHTEAPFSHCAPAAAGASRQNTSQKVGSATVNMKAGARGEWAFRLWEYGV